MTANDEAIKNICSQMTSCLCLIRAAASPYDCHYLETALPHFDLLLKLLQSKLSVPSYLESYESLVANNDDIRLSFAQENEQLRRIYENSISGGKSLDTIYVASDLHCFIEVLDMCNSNLKRYIQNNDYERIREDADLNHNIPGLFITNSNQNIHRYFAYFDPNRLKATSHYFSFEENEVKQSYVDIWQKIRVQYNYSESRLSCLRNFFEGAKRRFFLTRFAIRNDKKNRP